MPRPSPQTDRVIATIDMLAISGSALSLSEIARRLGVTPATCHPMISRLEAAGWLVRHPVTRGYRLGAALIGVGQAASGGTGALEASRPVMRELHHRLHLACAVLTVDERSAVVVDIVRGRNDRPSTLRVGDEVPMRPPLGITYMAWQPPDVVARWLQRGGRDDAEGLEGSRGRDAARYGELLEITRQRGYSVELASSIDARTRGAGIALLRSRLESELAAVAEQSAAGEGHPVNRLRSLLEDFAARAGGTDFELGRLEPDQRYHVDSVSAPVFRGDGTIALVLSLRGFPDPEGGGGVGLRGSAIAALGDELVRAANTVSRSIGGGELRTPFPARL